MADTQPTGYVPFLIGLTLGASIMYVFAVPSQRAPQLKAQPNTAGWYVLALGRGRNGRTALKYVVGPFKSEESTQSAAASVLQKGYQTRVRYYAKKPS